MQPETPRDRDPQTKREILRRIWQAIIRRPFTKLAALFIAIIFWVLVLSGDSNLMVERTIQNAAVTVSGTDLRSKGLIITDDLSANTITTKMRVEVRLGDYERALDALTPRLDLSAQITEAGTDQEVFFTVPATIYGRVISFDPPSIRVNVEAFVTRSRVQVVVETEGEAAEPLWISRREADPAYISISGPKSLIDQVRRAVVTLPLGSLSSARPSDNISGVITLQDADGKAISSPLMRITSESVTIDSVTIGVDVYPVAEVPVHTPGVATGLPAHGYQITGIAVSPGTVSVAASAEVLAALEALYVSTPLDLDGLTESVSASIPLRAVSDVQHMSVTEVTVDVTIEPAEHVHVYNNMPVTVLGLGEGLTATLGHGQMDVLLCGGYDHVQGLAQEDITLYVDAAGLAAGTHVLQVRCVVNGTEAFSYEPEYAYVTLTLAGEAAAPPPTE